MNEPAIIACLFVCAVCAYAAGWYAGRQARLDQQFRDWADRQRHDEDDADWWKK